MSERGRYMLTRAPKDPTWLMLGGLILAGIGLLAVFGIIALGHLEAGELAAALGGLATFVGAVMRSIWSGRLEHPTKGSDQG